MTKEELKANIDEYVKGTCIYYRSTHEDILPNQFEKYLRSACVHFATEATKELQEELEKWKAEWQEQVQKATDEGYARTLQTIQLTNAKEIIKNLISAYITYADSFDDRDNQIVAEAEQFLKESEVEK